MENKTEKTLIKMEGRLAQIERDIAEIKEKQESHYVTKEGLKLVEQTLSDLERRLVKVESNISQVVWIIIAAILVGVLNLIIK